MREKISLDPQKGEDTREPVLVNKPLTRFGTETEKVLEATSSMTEGERKIKSQIDGIEDQRKECAILFDQAKKLAKEMLSGDKSTETAVKLDVLRTSIDSRLKKISQDVERLESAMFIEYDKEDPFSGTENDRFKRAREGRYALSSFNSFIFRVSGNKEFMQIDGYEEIIGGLVPGSATAVNAEMPYSENYNPSEAAVINLSDQGYDFRVAEEENGQLVEMAKPGHDTPLLSPIFTKISDLEGNLAKISEAYKKDGKTLSDTEAEELSASTHIISTELESLEAQRTKENGGEIDRLRQRAEKSFWFVSNYLQPGAWLK